MAYAPNKNTRTFTLFTSPSVADPAWQIVMAESGNGGHAVYNDLLPLKELINEMEEKMIRDAEHNKTMDQVLEHLGVTFPEYMAMKKK